MRVRLGVVGVFVVAAGCARGRPELPRAETRERVSPSCPPSVAQSGAEARDGIRPDTSAEDGPRMVAPTWSPSGRWFAYVAWAGSHSEVVVVTKSFAPVLRVPCGESLGEEPLQFTGDDQLEVVSAPLSGARIATTYALPAGQAIAWRNREDDSHEEKVYREQSSLASRVSLHELRALEPSLTETFLSISYRDDTESMVRLSPQLRSALGDGAVAGRLALAAECALMALRSPGVRYDFRVGFVDLRNPKVLHVLPEVLSPALDWQLAPGGSPKHALLALVQGPGASPVLYELPSGRLKRTFTFAGARHTAGEGIDSVHARASLAFDRAGERLALASMDEPPRWFEVGSGRLIAAMRADELGPINEAARLGEGELRFTPDGERVIYFGARGWIAVANAADGKAIWVLDASEPSRGGVAANAASGSRAALSSDARFLAAPGTAGGHRLLIFDLAKQETFELESGEGDLAFTPSGHGLFAGGIVWNVQARTTLATLN